VRIAVIGGGPGASTSAISGKKRHPDARIDLFEQTPPVLLGALAWWSRAGARILRADDPDTVRCDSRRGLESWKNITLNLRGESARSMALEFSSIGRLDLSASCSAAFRSVWRHAALRNAGRLRRAVDRFRSDRRGRWPHSPWCGSRLRGRFRNLCYSYSANKFAWYGHHEAGSRRLLAEFVKPISARSTPITTDISPTMSTLPGRMRFADLAAIRLCRARRSIESQGHLATGVRRHPRRPGLVSNKIGLAQFPWIWTSAGRCEYGC